MQKQPSLLPTPPLQQRLWPSIIGIGTTQLIGWGTSFTALTVLGTRISQDLGISRTDVFGGMTVMMIVSAILAPRLGRQVDAEGARGLMVPGSLVGAVALLLIAIARGAVSFWFGWAVFGVSVAMMLTNAAVPALVQIAGPKARPAVTMLTIITGLTSAVFLPLTAWLETHFGWRLTTLFFAMLYLVICLPIHLAVLPHERPARQLNSSTGSEDVSWDGMIPERWKWTAFSLLAAWMAMQGLVVFGFTVQSMDILQGLGLTHSAAIGVWMFSGPSQAVARVADLASGGRWGVMSMAILSAICAPIGFFIAICFGVSIPTAAAVSISVGIGQGLYAVARNLVPLRLFGLRTFGETMGLLTIPLNAACAIAPIVFSWLMARGGAEAALWAAAIAAVMGLVSVSVLDRLVRFAAIREDV